MKARDGLTVEGNLWRPLTATGKRGGERVPTIIYPHGGLPGQSFRPFQPLKQLLVAEGLRCSTSTSAARPATGGHSAWPITASGATPMSRT